MGAIPSLRISCLADPSREAKTRLWAVLAGKCSDGWHLPLLHHRWLLQGKSHVWCIKTVRQKNPTRMTAMIFKVWVIALGCTALISADEDRTVSALANMFPGRWESTKVEVTDKTAFAGYTEKDGLILVFDQFGRSDWTMILTESGKKYPLRMDYMVGGKTISFHGGTIGTTGQAKVWNYTISDELLIMESVPAGVKFTLRKTKSVEQPGPAQPATQPADKPPVKDQPPTSTSKGSPR